MSLICERCGKEFDKEDAREEFEDETGKNFDYLTETLCGDCAIQAINNKEDGVYLELCENCGARFDPFVDEMEFQRQTGDDGVEIDMFGKYLCLNCSLEEYENFDPNEV